ncbi:MAG: hypothetical protein ACI379_09915 [Nocardioides sp.]|uniref:hypothetical protein n=1 Tax=Nocardioides sp. TaxID=35761 RepID=UPI003F0F9AB4
MEWLTDNWLDVLGWGGSAVLIYSLMQTRVLRFRVINLVGCVLLVAYNSLVGVWPMVGVNVVLTVINLWFIVSLVRDRHDANAFEVLGVRPDDEYLRHVVRVHEADIRTFNPSFVHDPFAENQSAYLVLKGDETIGVVLLRAEGDVAHVLLDYVTPRFRDFSPGEFVWRRSEMLSERGFRRVVTPAGMRDAYYPKIGFTRDGEAWALDLAS